MKAYDGTDIATFPGGLAELCSFMRGVHMDLGIEHYNNVFDDFLSRNPVLHCGILFILKGFETLLCF